MSFRTRFRLPPSPPHKTAQAAHKNGAGYFPAPFLPFFGVLTRLQSAVTKQCFKTAVVKLFPLRTEKAGGELVRSVIGDARATTAVETARSGAWAIGLFYTFAIHCLHLVDFFCDIRDYRRNCLCASRAMPSTGTTRTSTFMT